MLGCPVEDAAFRVRPVGYVFRGDGCSRISILTRFAECLECIEDFSHIVVLCWMHRARRDVLKVRPRPRPDVICGVFATRSPSRPNPIGLYVVKLLRREGNELHVEPMDAYDGTPVLDIKPYVPEMDRRDASGGWIGRARQRRA